MGGGGGNLKFLKKYIKVFFSYKNDAKFIILKSSRSRSFIIFLIVSFYDLLLAHTSIDLSNTYL